MGKIYPEPEESSLHFSKDKRCLLHFYFHGLGIELIPYAVEGLLVSELVEKFQAPQPVVIGFLESRQESFEFYLCINSIVICYKSIVYLQNCKFRPSRQNFTQIFSVMSSEFHVVFLQTSQQLRQHVIQCYL